MRSYLNRSAPAMMNLFLETVQPKQTISPFWRLVEERPIMPSRAPLEIPGEMRAFAELSVEHAKFAFDKFMDATQSTMSTFEAQSKVSQAATMKIMSFAGRMLQALSITRKSWYGPRIHRPCWRCTASS
jgi:hypothetical protein